MRGSSLPGEKHVQGNPLEFHLRMFAAALREAGYRDRAMCSEAAGRFGALAQANRAVARKQPSGASAGGICQTQAAHAADAQGRFKNAAAVPCSSPEEGRCFQPKTHS